MVAAGAAGLVEFLEGGAEPLEGLVGVERARHEPDTFQKLLPDLLPETGSGVLLDRVVDHLREILIGPVAAGETHQAETGGKQATVRQVVDGRHQFLPGKIARDAEDHQDAGARDLGSRRSRGSRSGLLLVTVPTIPVAAAPGVPWNGWRPGFAAARPPATPLAGWNFPGRGTSEPGDDLRWRHAALRQATRVPVHHGRRNGETSRSAHRNRGVDRTGKGATGPSVFNAPNPTPSMRRPTVPTAPSASSVTWRPRRKRPAWCAPETNGKR